MHKSETAMSKIDHNPGKLPKVFELMVHLHKNHPEAFEDSIELRRKTAETWHSLRDKTRCPNCKASMVAYWFEFDLPNAAMLVQMARVVRHNVSKGIPFTEANQIHVQSMNEASYAMKSRTTQMAKLGLIAKFTKNGHHVSGTWLITRRGWVALAGGRVPRKVESFRNEIIERDTTDTITIKEVFAEWTDKKRDLLRRGKKVKTDYTDEVDEYSQHNDWIHLGDLQPGELI